MVKRAIVRPPGRSYCECISSHPERDLLNLDVAQMQHRVYVQTLKDLGLDVIEMPPIDDLPDSCFVEDTAVIHGKKALMTRPNPISRRGEVDSVAQVLENYFEVISVESPGTVEGGDVIHLPERLISGCTQRTNLEGIHQMEKLLGVQVDVIQDDKIVHLKSYVTHLEEGKFIGSERYSQHSAFNNSEFITIPDYETYASNTLTINGTVIIPVGFPETKRILIQSGFDVVTLYTSEFSRCEGALTCLSIIF